MAYFKKKKEKEWRRKEKILEKRNKMDKHTKD